MHYRKLYPSNYIGEWDLDGKERELTIESAQRLPVFVPETNREEEKAVVVFKEAKKPFICNRTNGERIAEWHGNDTDQWVGKKVTLMPAKTKLKGKEVPCIRVKPKPEGGLRK